MTEYLALLGRLFYSPKGELREYWQTLPQVEREEFLKTLVLEDAGSLALYRLGPQLIPDAMACEMEETRLVLLSNSIKQETAFRQVFQLFETNGLRYAPIKGIDLAYRIYPSPSLRPFGDWDFLFPRQEMEQVYDCLRKDGWRELLEHSKEAGHHHFPPLVKDGFWLEPHWTLPCCEKSNADLLWENMTPQSPGSFHYLLSPELNLLLVARHAASSSYRGTRVTKMLLDAAFLIEKEGVDWEKCRRFCKEFDQPYPGSLFGAFPEFFPAEEIARMKPDVELGPVYRKIFETRRSMTKESFEEIVMLDERRFSFAWMKKHLSTFLHPQSIRFKYSLPTHGRWGALCLAYIRDFCSKLRRIGKFLLGKRQKGVSDYLHLVQTVEKSRS